MPVSIRVPVADPDLQMGVGGGGGRAGCGRSSRPGDKGGGPSKKTKSFRSFGPHFGLEVTGEGSGPPVPLAWIRH